jgi:hypothetical protein
MIEINLEQVAVFNAGCFIIVDMISKVGLLIWVMNTLLAYTQ